MLKEACIGITMRYEIRFVEVGMDEDHVHFLVQSVPTMSVCKIVTIIKSISAHEIFARHKEVKKFLCGREPLDKRFLREYCERMQMWKASSSTLRTRGPME